MPSVYFILFILLRQSANALQSTSYGKKSLFLVLFSVWKKRFMCAFYSRLIHRYYVIMDYYCGFVKLLCTLPFCCHFISLLSWYKILNFACHRQLFNLLPFTWVHNKYCFPFSFKVSGKSMCTFGKFFDGWFVFFISCLTVHNVTTNCRWRSRSKPNPRQ